MNYVDIGILIFVALFTLIGIKRGVIKSALKTVGIVVIAIIAYSFKGYLASWLMSFMPFFNFIGLFEGVKAINILFYEAVSFLLIFIILYCVLNIIVALGGIMDKLVRKTIILAIPDRILGGVVGFIEGTILSFVIVFVLSQLPNTQNIVFESRFGVTMLERTPVIRTVLSNSTLAAEEIYQLADQYKDSENKTDFNIAALQVLIKYKIVTADEVKDLEDAGKLDIENITFN